MKTIKKVEIEPIFVDGYMPPFETMKDGEFYISKEHSVAIHRCLCGCGEKTVTPFELTNEMPESPHVWGLNIKGDKVSLIGSVGNFQFPCKSHYIITNNIANFV